MNDKTLHVGDEWLIWITGNTEKFRACVEQVDPPRLRVLTQPGETPWPMLKDGDFILLERLT